jgi:hypothetical protein
MNKAVIAIAGGTCLCQSYIMLIRIFSHRTILMLQNSFSTLHHFSLSGLLLHLICIVWCAYASRVISVLLAQTSLWCWGCLRFSSGHFGCDNSRDRVSIGMVVNGSATVNSGSEGWLCFCIGFVAGCRVTFDVRSSVYYDVNNWLLCHLPVTVPPLPSQSAVPIAHRTACG